MVELQEENDSSAVEWRIIQSECETPGALGVPVYGVEAWRGRSLWQWPDVDVDLRRVEQLIEMLRSADPEPCHWENIVEDFILA